MDKLPEGFVLEEDTQAQTEGLPPGFVLEAEDPMEKQGFLEKTRKALQYGAAQRAVGYGKTGQATIGRVLPGTGDGVVEVGKAIAPDDYRPASKDFFDPQEKDKGLLGYGWGYAPRAILESAPGLAADLIAARFGGMPGFMASNAAANFGPTLEARVQNNGGKDFKDATAVDYGVAALGTGINAYLNKVGINPAVNSVAKGAGAQAIAQIPGQIAKAAGVDAATGAAGNLVDQVATTAGTEKGLDVNAKEVLGSGALSGATGAAVRATRIPGDITNAVRNVGFDEKSATRVADYLKSLPEKFTDGESNYHGVRAAEDHFNGRLDDALKNAKGYIDETGVGEALADLRNRLDHGYELNARDLEDIKTKLGERDDGLEVVRALQDRQTINQLKQKGTWDKSSEHFDGGIAGKFGNILDPRRTIGRTAGKAAAAAGVASQYALPFAGQLGLASGALAKFLALQAGTYAGAKAIDKVTGLADPVRDFRDRFSGFAEQDAPLGVTTKGLQAEQKSQDEMIKTARDSARAQRWLEGLRNRYEDQTYRDATNENKRRDLADDRMYRDAKNENSERNAQAKAQAQEVKELLKTARDARRIRERTEDFQYRDAKNENVDHDRQVRAQEQAEAAQMQDIRSSIKDIQKRETLKNREEDRLNRVAQAENSNVDAQMAEARKRMSAIQKVQRMKAKAQGAELTDLPDAEGIAEAIRNAEPIKGTTKEQPKSTAKKAKEALEKLQKAEESSKAEEAPKEKKVTISEDGYEVERTIDDKVKKPQRYIEAVRTHLKTRAALGRELETLVGDSKSHLVKALVNKMNKQARSYKDAYDFMEDFVNSDEFPESLAGKAFDIWNKHDANIKATYRE